MVGHKVSKICVVCLILPYYWQTFIPDNLFQTCASKDTTFWICKFLRLCMYLTALVYLTKHTMVVLSFSQGGSNYDSLIARTVAYPVQVAYWILRSWPPADTVSHVNFDQWSGDMAVGSCGLEAILA